MRFSLLRDSKKQLLCALICSLSCGLLPLHAFAVAYTPMVTIPGFTGTLNVENYINAIYLLAISVGAILAVLKITIAGVKYMLSDVVTSKESAKKDIQGALFGLLIVLAAVVILNTINPTLSRFAIFYTGVTGDIITGSGSTGGGGGSGITPDDLQRPDCPAVAGRPQIPQLRNGGWSCADLFTEVEQRGLSDDAQERLQALIDNDQTPPDVAARAREILRLATEAAQNADRSGGGNSGGSTTGEANCPQTRSTQGGACLDTNNGVGGVCRYILLPDTCQSASTNTNSCTCQLLSDGT